jgi:L-iditol 2-dehydrogenase
MKMKALMIYGKNDYALTEIDKPAHQDNEVLLRSAYASICGTDLAIINGRGPKWTKLPIVPGHEYCGIVEEVGRSVKNIKVGDKVIVDNYISCNGCYYCKKGEYFYCDHHYEPGFTINGGMADYSVIPYTNLVPIPEGLPMKYASITEPAANALRGVEAAQIKRGDVVLIMGSGPIGALSGMICKAQGAHVIVLGRGERFKRFEGMGFDRLIDTSKEDWVDVVCTNYGSTTRSWGTEAIDKFIDATQTGDLVFDALKITRRKGVGILIGLSRDGSELTIPKNDTVFKDITLIGTTSGQGFFFETLDYMLRGDIDASKIITHYFPLDKSDEAYGVFKNRVDGAMKVVIDHGVDTQA